MNVQTKTDDHIKEDFHIIKHLKITDFLMHLGLSGLACMWKLATTSVAAPVPVWETLAIASAIWYFIWVCLYLAKTVVFFKKVRGNTLVYTSTPS